MNREKLIVSAVCLIVGIGFCHGAAAEDLGKLSAEVRYTRPISDLATGGGSVESDTANGVAVLLDVQQRRWVFRFLYEHDYGSAFSLLLRALDMDSGEFARDRWEATAGFSSPYAEIEGGFRNERINFAGHAFGREDSIGEVDNEFLAGVAGVVLHTARQRPVQAELTLRGYYGGSGWTAQRRFDTRGYRVELALPIALGRDSIHIVPGVAREHLRTGVPPLTINARSYFVGIRVTPPGQ